MLRPGVLARAGARSALVQEYIQSVLGPGDALQQLESFSRAIGVPHNFRDYLGQDGRHCTSLHFKGPPRGGASRQPDYATARREAAEKFLARLQTETACWQYRVLMQHRSQ